MTSQAARYGTVVGDGRIAVATGEGRLHVGRVETVIGLVGGPAWTITYSEAQKRRYPDVDTDDEGLTVDVVDMINNMRLERAFVESLQVLPDEPLEDRTVSPREGLFVGRLLDELETGLA
jgi:hypothetical protein